jgi:hypothetical protein
MVGISDLRDGEDMEVLGSRGPFTFVRKNGMDMTIFEGPFMMRVFPSGPVAKAVRDNPSGSMGSGKKNNDGDDDGSMGRGSSSSRTSLA